MSRNTATMSLPAPNGFTRMLSSWAERLNEHLFWIAFLQNGQAQKIIYNPESKVAVLGEPALFTSLSEIASKLSTELCPGCFSQVAIRMERVQYICFCQTHRPSIIVALDGSTNPENFWGN